MTNAYFLGGRKKSLCCTPAEISEVSCDTTACKSDLTFRCGEDPDAQDYSVDESADDTDPNDLTKRDLEGLYGNPWNAEQGKEPNTNFDSSTISTLY